MKKIILLCLILLLCGCSTVNYNLNITDKVEEKLEIIASCTDCDLTDFNIPTRKYYNDDNFDPYDTSRQDNVVYYNQSKQVTSDNKTILTYSQTFNFNEYYNSYIAKKFYNDFEVSYRDNILTIDSGLNFYLDDNVDEVAINITTDHKVTEANADKYENNTYTWIINKQNYSNKNIIMSIDFNEETTVLLIVILPIIFIISLILLIMYNKNKKDNQI